MDKSESSISTENYIKEPQSIRIAMIYALLMSAIAGFA